MILENDLAEYFGFAIREDKHVKTKGSTTVWLLLLGLSVATFACNDGQVKRSKNPLLYPQPRTMPSIEEEGCGLDTLECQSTPVDTEESEEIEQTLASGFQHGMAFRRNLQTSSGATLERTFLALTTASIDALSAQTHDHIFRALTDKRPLPDSFRGSVTLVFVLPASALLNTRFQGSSRDASVKLPVTGEWLKPGLSNLTDEARFASKAVAYVLFKPETSDPEGDPRNRVGGVKRGSIRFFRGGQDVIQGAFEPNEWVNFRFEVIPSAWTSTQGPNRLAARTPTAPGGADYPRVAFDTVFVP